MDVTRSFAVDTVEGRLAETISQLTRGWMRLARERSRELGLSFPQMMVLAAVEREGGMPATRWAELMGASPSATTSLLDGLESEGYLRRTHDAADRRQVLVSLTPKGRRLTTQIRSEFMERWSSLCRDIPPSRLESTTGVLQQLIRGLEAPSAAVPRTPRANRRRP